MAATQTPRPKRAAPKPPAPDLDGIPDFLKRKPDGTLLHPSKSSKKSAPPVARPGAAPKPDVWVEPTVLERAMCDERFDLVPPKVWKMLPRHVEDAGLRLLFWEYAGRAERSAARREERAVEKTEKAQRESAVTLRQIVTEMSQGRPAVDRVRRSAAAKILLKADYKEPVGGWKFDQAQVPKIKEVIEKGLKK